MAAQRDALATVVRQFLDGEIGSFKFDDILDDYRDSRDSAVRFVSLALWYHYDDLEDHKVVASKEEWDFFQRLLLILRSDADLVEIHAALRAGLANGTLRPVVRQEFTVHLAGQMKAAMKEGGKEMPPEVLELIRSVKAHAQGMPHPVAPIP